MSGKGALGKVNAPVRVTKEQALQYRKVFEVFDTNHNGTIEFSELDLMVARIYKKKPSKGELQALMLLVDVNNDNKIDFEEFCYLMMRLVNKDGDQAEKEISRVFNHFDEDKNGYIDKHEMAAVFAALGLDLSPDEIDDIFSLFDEDNNTFIDFLEFKKAYIKYSMKGILDEKKHGDEDEEV